MKKLQTFVAGLLSVCLLTCSASALSFPDVDSNSSYAAAIEYVSTIGIMVGDSNGNFNPNGIVNRAEMATIVCRVLNQAENLSKTNVFTDVPTTHWGNAYIGKASELGIVGGYGGGKFGPGDPVTYEQAITMIVRAIGEGDKASSYGGYPNGFIQVAREKNLLNGIQAVQGQGLSRGAVAMLLYNYYVALNNPSTPIEGPTTPNTPDIAEDGHTHQWETVHIPASGHYDTGGTHKVLFKKCDCGFTVNSDMPNMTEIWRNHIFRCEKRSIFWYEDVPNSEPIYVVDYPGKDVTYCPLCGAEK